MTLNQTISNEGLWGRAWTVSSLTKILTLLILVLTPFMVIYFYIACTQYSGSLVEPLRHGFKLPTFSFKALGIGFGWLSLQLFLSIIPDRLNKWLPFYEGGVHQGSVTPAGHTLGYQVNGLQAWVVTHLIFFMGAFTLNWFSPSIVGDHWGEYLWISNLFGYSLAFFVYWKANAYPSYPKDRKYSGNWIYDFYMGIELNPRIKNFDFKLFFNGRPGIVAWTLINFSFAATQFKLYGTVTNSMILVNVLQAIYVLDFFWNERWYLKTIDIAHDHFGWMLAWGDLVWLPYMYTLQGLYLVYHPVELSTSYALFVLILGLVGYGIFRTSNNQKDRFRRNDGNVEIWGEKAKAISCQYHAADGEIRHSKLLYSGWWGIARHFNYTGDLLLSLSYCLACGFDHLLPYFYIIYMGILLVHRCIRCEHRCQHKYGKAWNEYCEKVPYRLIPGVF